MSVDPIKYNFFSHVHGRSITGIHDTSGDLISWPSDLEATNAELSEIALRQARIAASLVTGCAFEALNKKYRNKEQHSVNAEFNNNDAGGPSNSGGSDGPNLEQHPELPYTGGGKADQIYPTDDNLDLFSENDPLIPESVRDQKRKRKEKDRKELANRLSAKNKIKFKLAPAAEPKYRYSAPPPKNRPKPRPPGV